jgi:hypothetical protein
MILHPFDIDALKPTHKAQPKIAHRKHASLPREHGKAIARRAKRAKESPATTTA